MHTVMDPSLPSHRILKRLLFGSCETVAKVNFYLVLSSGAGWHSASAD